MIADLWQLVVTQAWQIAVLTVLVALLSRTVIRHRPHFAHALWLLVLIKCVTPPLWGHSLGLFSRLQAIVTAEAVPGQSVTASAGPSEPADSFSMEELNPDSDAAAADVADGVEFAGRDPGELLPRSNEQPEAFSSVSHELPARHTSVSLPSVILLTALVGGCLTFCVMVLRYLRCRRLISRGRTTDWDATLSDTLRLLAKQLGIRRVPQVVVSDVQFGPAILGLYRHTIVLPKCLLSVRNTCAGEFMHITTSSMSGSQSRSCLPGRTAAAGGPAIPSATSDLNPRDTVETAQLAASREVPPGRRDVPTTGSQGWSCLPGRTAAKGGPAILNATSDSNPRDTVETAQLAASREVPPGRRDVPTAGSESRSCLPGRTAAEGGHAVPSATPDLNLRDAVETAQLAAGREVPPGSRDVPTAGSQSRSCLPGRTAAAGGPAISSATPDLNPRDTVETAQLAASREVPPGSRDVPTAGSESRSCLPGRTAAAGGPAISSAMSEVDPRDTGESAQVAAGREVPPGRRDLLTADVPTADGSELFSCLPEFLVPILAHELLHLRRGDLLTGVLQAVAQCFWWFHPAVWYTNRWLSREAERCCDEQVIAELGCSPAEYARSLLSVIECKHQLQPVPVFPGMKPVEITSQRMERIMSLKNGLKKRTPVTCWLLMAVLAVIILPGAANNDESGNQKPKIGDKSSTSTQSNIEIEPNIALNDSEQQSQQSVPVHSEKKVITRAYMVSDLVWPAAENTVKLDCAPLVELIRTIVTPESWSKDKAEIGVDQNTGSIVIRHSRETHDEIARLLQAIRKNQTAVRLECRLLSLAEETSFQLIQNRCSLQPNGTGHSWALLTSASAEALLQSLNEQGCEVLYVPTIITTSGLDARISDKPQIESSLPGFSISATPDPVPDSSVIRLKYSVTVDGLRNISLETTRFSFVGSGQTLLLVMEQPVDSEVSGAAKRFVVMLTPSCVKEETETLSSPSSE